MNKKTVISLAVAVVFTAGCFGETVSPEGRWVQPTPSVVPMPDSKSFFMNCSELRTHYGHLIPVPSDHPSYRPELDDDKDGLACEIGEGD